MLYEVITFSCLHFGCQGCKQHADSISEAEADACDSYIIQRVGPGGQEENFPDIHIAATRYLKERDHGICTCYR